MGSELLPPAPSALEAVLADVGEEFWQIPIEIRHLKNPDLIPEHLLPYLAWELSVDIWEETWPIGKKRQVVRDAIELHRLKGTLEGIKRHVALTGAEVVGARVPPNGLYPAAGQTPEEKAAFLAQFRQIRVYPFRDTAIGDFGIYPGRYGDMYPGNDCFPDANVAAAYIGKRTFVFDPLTGIETPTKRIERFIYEDDGTARQIDHLVVPGQSEEGLFCGSDFIADAYFYRGADQILTTYSDRSYNATLSGARVYTVELSIDPISMVPTRIVQEQKAEYGDWFVGDFITPANLGVGDFDSQMYLTPNVASFMIYDVIYLHEPERVADGSTSIDYGSFIGHSYFSIPPYTAEVNIRALTPKRWDYFIGESYVGDDFVGPKLDMLSDAFDAVNVSQALRDTVRVNPQTYRRLRFSDRPRLDAGLRFGQWIETPQ